MSTSPRLGSDGGMSVLDYLNILAKHSWFIFKGVVAAVLLGAIVLFIIPQRFKATALILAPQSNMTMINQFLQAFTNSPIAALASGTTGLGASLLGLKNPGDLYAAILNSEAIHDRIIDDFKLRSYYQSWYEVFYEPHIEDIREILEKRVDVKSGDEGIISIAVTDEDPKQAAAMANAFVAELSKVMQQVSVKEATLRYDFIENELTKIKEDLKKEEDSFEAFAKENNIVRPSSQVAGIIEYIGALKSTIDAKVVQLASLRQGSTPSNYEVIRTEAELESMRKILRETEAQAAVQTKGNLFVPTSKFSELEMQYQRKMRDLKFQEEFFKAMSQLREIARLDKIKDAVIISVLRRASEPEKKSFPKRGTSLIVIAILSGLTFIGIAFARERWSVIKQEKASELHEIKQNLEYWRKVVTKLKNLTKRKS